MCSHAWPNERPCRPHDDRRPAWNKCRLNHRLECVRLRTLRPVAGEFDESMHSGSPVSFFMGNPSQSYGASSAIWDYTVLPATRHRWTRSAVTPCSHTGRYSIYLPRRDGRLSSVRPSWVDLSVGYIRKWFTCSHTGTRPGTVTTRESIATGPGVEPNDLAIAGPTS